MCARDDRGEIDDEGDTRRIKAPLTDFFVF